MRAGVEDDNDSVVVHKLRVRWRWSAVLGTWSSARVVTVTSTLSLNSDVLQTNAGQSNCHCPNVPTFYSKRSQTCAIQFLNKLPFLAKYVKRSVAIFIQRDQLEPIHEFQISFCLVVGATNRLSSPRSVQNFRIWGILATRENSHRALTRPMRSVSSLWPNEHTKIVKSCWIKGLESSLHQNL